MIRKLLQDLALLASSICTTSVYCTIDGTLYYMYNVSVMALPGGYQLIYMYIL